MLPGLGSAIVGAGFSGIQFVGGAVAGKVGATSGNSTIALNSGLTGGIASAAQAGDFVLAAFATGALSDRTLVITDGTNNYTLVGSELYSSASGIDTNLRVAYKFITSDTDTTFGPTQSNDDAGVMAVYVFRGINTTTPLDVTPTTATASFNQRPDPPAITPVTPGAFIVAIGAGGGLLSPDPFEQNFGGTLKGFIKQFQTDTNNAAMSLGYKDDWVSGSYDPPLWNFSSNPVANTVASMTIALRPA